MIIVEIFFFSPEIIKPVTLHCVYHWSAVLPSQPCAAGLPMSSVTETDAVSFRGLTEQFQIIQIGVDMGSSPGSPCSGFKRLKHLSQTGCSV